MNKTIAILICLIPFAHLRADSIFPFDDFTQEVFIDTLRLRLTDEQQTEVASVGRITFTEKQIVWLRIIYPKIPASLRVITSMYNDAGEGDDRARIDCIWSTPNEVSITLKEKVDGVDYNFDNDAIGDFADIRISPFGTLYHKGQEITLEKAFEIVRTAKKKDEASIIRITPSPPFHPKSGNAAEENNKKAADLFTALALYGESLNVVVFPTW